MLGVPDHSTMARSPEPSDKAADSHIQGQSPTDPRRAQFTGSKGEPAKKQAQPQSSLPYMVHATRSTVSAASKGTHPLSHGVHCEGCHLLWTELCNMCLRGLCCEKTLEPFEAS